MPSIGQPPRAEQIIAEYIGIKPEDIGPNRYTNGQPNTSRRHPRKSGSRVPKKCSTTPNRGNACHEEEVETVARQIRDSLTFALVCEASRRRA